MTRSALLAALLLLAACGGDSGTGPNVPPPPPPPPTGAGTFSATIDGQPWAATSSLIFAGSHIAAGAYVFGGTFLQGGVSRAISITIMNVPGPGTYPLGTGSGVAGGIAIYAENSGGWGTSLNGRAGTITLTTLTDSRAVGTFSFVAAVASGGATGTRTVTAGAFNIAINTNGTIGPVTEVSHSVLSANLGGQPYNAGTIARFGSAATQLSLASGDTEYSVSLTLSGITAAGTYPIGVTNVPALSVGTQAGAVWSSTSGVTGTLTVTSLSATRIHGTFTATLNGSGVGGATSPMSVTDGVFDIAL